MGTSSFIDLKKMPGFLTTTSRNQNPRERREGKQVPREMPDRLPPDERGETRGGTQTFRWDFSG